MNTLVGMGIGVGLVFLVAYLIHPVLFAANILIAAFVIHPVLGWAVSGCLILVYFFHVEVDKYMYPVLAVVFVAVFLLFLALRNQSIFVYLK